MTVNKLNEAISLIDDRYLDMVDSEEKEISIMSNTRKTRPVRKKAFAALIAAVVFLLACSVTAFAMSEDFRTAVLSFLHIQAEDKVEQKPAEDLPLQTDTGIAAEQAEAPAVTVSRVCVPDDGYASNGLFYVCVDKNEYNSGSRYNIYDMANGELVLLKKNEFSASCKLNGKDYPINLEWAENGYSIGIGYVGSPKLTDGSSTEGTYTVCQTFCPDKPKALLLLEADGINLPVIADLKNNTASPVEINVSGSLPEGICAAEISEDGSTLLLKTTDPDGKYYGVDIVSGKFCCLNELCGGKLYGCRFASDTQLVCWSISGGTSPEAMEELLAKQAAGQVVTDTTIDCGSISVWVVTPGSEAAKAVLSDVPATAYTNPDAMLSRAENDFSESTGILCISGRYAVERKADGKPVVYDFIENTQTTPDNFILSTENSLDMTVSPDGTKLLLVERNGDDGALIKLSVLDMRENRFIEIDRDPDAVGNEHWADWFDNSTVLVDNNTYDTAGKSTGDSWCYLYRLEESANNGPDMTNQSAAASTPSGFDGEKLIINVNGETITYERYEAGIGSLTADTLLDTFEQETEIEGIVWEVFSAKEYPDLSYVLVISGTNSEWTYVKSK